MGYDAKTLPIPWDFIDRVHDASVLSIETNLLREHRLDPRKNLLGVREATSSFRVTCELGKVVGDAQFDIEKRHEEGAEETEGDNELVAYVKTVRQVFATGMRSVDELNGETEGIVTDPCDEPSRLKLSFEPIVTNVPGSYRYTAFRARLQTERANRLIVAGGDVTVVRDNLAAFDYPHAKYTAAVISVALDQL